MSDNATSSNNYDEIDLIEVLIKINDFFKRKAVLIIITTILFAAALISFSYFLNLPTFKSRMIVSARVFSGSEMAVVLDNLSLLIKNNDPEKLSKILNQPIEAIKTLKDIEVSLTKNMEKQIQGDIRRDSSLTIIVEASSNKYFNTFEKGILYYITNNPYVKRRTEIYLQNQKELLKTINSEIQKINELKSKIEATPEKAILLPLSAGTLYQETVKLYERKLDTQENIEFGDDIEILQGFIIPSQPSILDLKTIIILGVVLGVLLGIFLGIIMDLRRIIRNRKKV